MTFFEDKQKAKTASSLNLDLASAELLKAELDELEKGGKRAVIGEKRIFGGREYIKTKDGWKFHGKGGGTKAQGHAREALQHHANTNKHKDATGKDEDADEPLVSPEMSKYIKEKVGNSTSEKMVIGAMRLFAQNQGNTYTIADYNDMYDEYISSLEKSSNYNDLNNNHILEHQARIRQNIIKSISPDATFELFRKKVKGLRR